MWDNWGVGATCNLWYNGQSVFFFRTKVQFPCKSLQLYNCVRSHAIGKKCEYLDFEYASPLYVYVNNLKLKIDKFISTKGKKLNLKPYPPWQINCLNFSVHIRFLIFFTKYVFIGILDLTLKCGIKLGCLGLGLLKFRIHHRFKLLRVIRLGLHYIVWGPSPSKCSWMKNHVEILHGLLWIMLVGPLGFVF